MIFAFSCSVFFMKGTVILIIWLNALQFMLMVSSKAVTGLSITFPLIPMPAELMRRPTAGCSALSLSSINMMPKLSERSATTGTILTPLMDDANSLRASSRLATAQISSKGVLKYSPLSCARSSTKALPMPDELPVIIAILWYIKSFSVRGSFCTFYNTLYKKILKENAFKADALLVVIKVE